MSPLIIVESPAKCKYIEEWTGYNCIASYGHFRSLKTLSDSNDEYNKFGLLTYK